MKIVFFGSFLEYSANILQSLADEKKIDVLGVVTTPPMPAGRKKVLTKTHVHELAEALGIPVMTPADLTDQSLDELAHTFGAVDYFVTAGYGKILPPPWLSYPTRVAVNLHFSLLPDYRGANPGEWAILMGETETGVTLITMSEGIDAGDMIAQARCSIEPQDTRETLYEKLYQLGADTLPAMLATYDESRRSSDPQLRMEAMPQPAESPTPAARRFIRAHGFVHWKSLSAAMSGEPVEAKYLSTHLKTIFAHLDLAHKPAVESAQLIERAVRGLYGFPGVWTHVPLIKGKQRMKIWSAHMAHDQLVLDDVQIEGKTKTSYESLQHQVLL